MTDDSRAESPAATLTEPGQPTAAAPRDQGHGEPPAEPPTERPDRVRRWPRLTGEAVGIAMVTLLLSYRAIPPLRDRRQTIFQDVMVNAGAPQWHGFARWVADGIWLPTWLRTNYGGEPYFANTQKGVAYPGNLPYWFLPTSQAIEVVIVLHFVVAAVGMWAYCRLALRTSMWAAWLGAVCFVLGGGTLTHVVMGDQLQVICLTPLVFLTGHMALERRRLRWVVGCAVAIGLTFLAGHAEEWVYVMVTLALYGAAWILFRERGGQLRRAGQAALTLGGAVALFALLFGWQLLPSLLLRGQTYRASADFRQQYPLPGPTAVNALLPDYTRVLVGENQAFVGVAALCLVGLALVTRRRELNWVRAWILLAAAVGFLFALGNQDAIYRFVYDHVSVIRAFRVPTRWLLVASFAFCVGAAVGLDELLTAYVGRWRARLSHGAAGLLVLGLGLGGVLLLADVTNDGVSWKRWGLAGAVGAAAWLLAGVRRVPRAIPALVLLAVTSLELVYARPFAEYQQKAPNAIYDAYGDNLETIGAGGGRYLTIGRTPVGNQGLEIPVPDDLPPGPTPRQYFLAGAYTRVIARPDTNLAVQAETIIGRDGGFLPLRWYREFYYAVGGGGDLNSGVVGTPPSRWNWTALDLLALRWFVAGDDLPESEQAVLRQHGFEVDGKYGYAVRWKRDGTSLARLVHAVDVVPAGQDRIARLQAGYPLLQRALVEQPVRVDPAPATAAGDRVEVTAVAQTSVDVRVTTDRRSLLVLADPWYPGWQVTIDGRPAPLLRTDHAFRGVVVPAGEHTLRFGYTDRRLRLGAGLAGLTILGLALTPLAARVRRRRSRPDQPAPPAGADDSDHVQAAPGAG